MTDLETQVRALADRRFAATSPVAFDSGPDVDDERTTHETEIIMRSNDTVQQQPNHRRWYILGAAAGLIAIAVVAIALAARDTDTPAPAPAATAPPTLAPAVTPTAPPPTVAPAVGPTAPPTLPAPAPTPIELIGADGDAEATAAFEVVADAYEAFNTGDALGWATPRGASADSTEPAELPDSELDYVDAAHAAGARYDVSSCEYAGFVTVRDQSGHRFECWASMIDAFTMAAGIDFRERFVWVVADGRVVDAVSTHGDLTELRTFLNFFGNWVESEHPDTPFTMIHFWNYPLADEVPAVLDLVDEFLASDDRWPLAEG